MVHVSELRSEFGLFWDAWLQLPTQVVHGRTWSAWLALWLGLWLEWKAGENLYLSQCLLLIFCVLSFCDIIFVTNIFNFYCLHTVAWYACNAVSANTSTGYFQRNVPSAFYVSFLLHQIGVGAICLLDGHSVCLSVWLAVCLAVCLSVCLWAE